MTVIAIMAFMECDQNIRVIFIRLIENIVKCVKFKIISNRILQINDTLNFVKYQGYFQKVQVLLVLIKVGKCEIIFVLSSFSSKIHF